MSINTPSPGRPSVRPVPALLASALLAALALSTTGPTLAQDTADRGDESQPAGFFTEVMKVRVINVDVVVTNRAGRTITGLTADDFELRVDGRPVAISNFYSEAAGSARERAQSTARTIAELPSDSSFRPLQEVQAAAPRRGHVVVLIDHTRLRANNRKRAFEALRQALAGLSKNDVVSVVGIEGSLVFYSDFLYDRPAIGRILDDVTRISTQSDINENERRQIFGELARGQSGGLQARASQAEGGALISRIRSYSAQEYARSLTSLRQIERVVSTLAGVPGRKVLLYLAEGIPTRPGEGLYVEWRNRFGGGSPNAEIGIRRIDFNSDYTRAVGRYDLNDTIRKLATAANRAGVTLYSIDAEGNHGGEIRSALTEQGATSETVSVIDENYRAPLEQVTKATGGRLLRSSGLLAEQIVDLIGELHTFYSLGFAPPSDWEAGSDHSVKVGLRGDRKGLVVRHREQVRLPEPDEIEAAATVAALMYQTADNPLGIRAFPGTEVPRQDGTAALPVTLEIPVGKLGFVPQGDSQAGSLTFYVSIKRANGHAGRVQKIPFHLAIPNDKIEEARGESAHYPLPVVLHPGDQQVAIGIRDNIGGTFSAVRIDVSQYSRFSGR